MFFKKNIPLLKKRLAQDKIQTLIYGLLSSRVLKSAPNNCCDFFIVDNNKKICVCISDSFIKIIGEDFIYSTRITLKFSDKMKSKVIQSILLDHERFKKQMFQREIDLLNVINKN